MTPYVEAEIQPVDIARWIADFDNGRPVEPATFRVFLAKSKAYSEA